MIPQSELIGCRDCGLVFWRKADNMKTSKGKEICPHCESRDTDMIDRAS
jgi:Zn finger protein HypA/HybF involved in hydrogenase expression